MQDNNMFSDIPALNDANGLAQYVEQQNAAQYNTELPGALQQPVTPNVEETEEEPTTFTSEQVQQIIQAVQAQQQQQRQQQVTQQQATQVRQTQPTQAAYTPQELNAINTLLSRGYSLEQVMQAVQSHRMKTNGGVDPAVIQKINNIEQYLQNQQYQAELNSFTTKMTTFGNKFGLSEADLVTFGNQALEKGINLIIVQDVEMVFKAMYPEQYAIRMQRMSNTPTSQIYGGTSVPENNRVVNERAVDAYVDAFLKRSMPNQYGMQKK